MFDHLKAHRGSNPKNVLVNAAVCKEGEIVKFAIPSKKDLQMRSTEKLVAANAGAGLTGALPNVSKAIFRLTDIAELTCRPLSAILLEAGAYEI